MSYSPDPLTGEADIGMSLKRLCQSAENEGVEIEEIIAALKNRLDYYETRLEDNEPAEA